MRLLLLRGMVALVVAAAAVGLASGPGAGAGQRVRRNADAGGAGRVTAAGACRPARGYHPKPVRTTWNVFQLSGRVSSTSGDPARWQRYEDLRDGLLFTGARFQRDTPEWSVTAGADNIGYRDQRCGGTMSGLDASASLACGMKFRSSTASTPARIRQRDDGLQLADSVQQSVQNQTATLNAYVPISPQFNLRESRDIGAVRVTATPTRQVDVSGGFTSTGHSGELPWGGSFGFNNNTEVALPYRSRTNDLDVGAEWTNTRSMFRTAYTGSWFNNENDTLVWDSPLRLTTASSSRGAGGRRCGRPTRCRR